MEVRRTSYVIIDIPYWPLFIGESRPSQRMQDRPPRGRLAHFAAVLLRKSATHLERVVWVDRLDNSSDSDIFPRLAQPAGNQPRRGE